MPRGFKPPGPLGFARSRSSDRKNVQSVPPSRPPVRRGSPGGTSTPGRLHDVMKPADGMHAGLRLRPPGVPVRRAFSAMHVADRLRGDDPTLSSAPPRGGRTRCSALARETEAARFAPAARRCAGGGRAGRPVCRRTHRRPDIRLDRHHLGAGPARSQSGVYRGRAPGGLLPGRANLSLAVNPQRRKRPGTLRAAKETVGPGPPAPRKSRFPVNAFRTRGP